MAPKQKRRTKRKFGDDPRHAAWDKPDGFVFLHKPALDVSEEQVDAIAATLGVGIAHEHVAAVLAAIRRFDGRGTAMAELQPGDHRVRDIETLSALARAMDGMNSNVMRTLVKYGAELDIGEPTRVAEVARLAAEDIVQAITPKKSGRKRKGEGLRDMLFRELAEIYTTATGRAAKMVVKSEVYEEAGQPTGRFFAFVRAAVAPVPELGKLKDHALSQAVKRALSRTE